MQGNPFPREQDVLTLPLLPLKDIVVFPHMIVPVFINEDLCIKAVEFSLSKTRKIFLSAFKVEGHEGRGLESSLEPPFDVYDMGTICSIMRTRKLPDGRMKVLVQGLQKAVAVRLVEQKDFPNIEVRTIREPTIVNQSSSIEATVRAVRENLEKVVSLGRVLSPDILMILEDVREPGRLADLVAANLGLKVEDAQKILSVFDPIERLARVHTFLSREIEVCQMQVKIQNQAKEEIGKLQREHYLREQIRALKSELGDADPRDEMEDLWKRVNEAKLSPTAKDELARQLRRLEKMHQDTSEASLVRTHVETILDLPWQEFTEDTLDLKNVSRDLDADHYGLHKVKDRIIEYLAVKKLNPQAKSPILCFVGPPGVGKTSLGKSIARSIGRKFERISVGGVRDEADIRGHRKTYVGAFPGRVVCAIKNAKSANPIIMLDEIDKLGQDYRGDPASALLEVLDPEQNHQFVDHYLGIPFDLSKVMFIANANTLDTIHPALRDRLEVIELSGYSEDEKSEIADRFLIPKQARETGLAGKTIDLSKSAVVSLIRGYTRESGLRNLEKQIASICRKIARDVAEGEKKEDVFRVTPAKVQKYLGARIFGEDFFPHADTAAGISFGMAYTRFGGEILTIETNLLPGKEGLVLTGQLGDVMKESAQAALSFVKSRAEVLGVDWSLLKTHEIHVHVPQGAVSKDGPSAGVAIASSILSALLCQKIASKTCMTGEITIHGKVLPIGGVKEKLLAAQREGMKNVILPLRNKLIVDDLPASVKKKLKLHYIENYWEAFSLLFPVKQSAFVQTPEERVSRPSPTDLAS
ncbi:MAG: endopeptidase La [Deltaproteobacteria bacterium]|nr:endopeptidase La [Deltaproteobacteria bacterium]